ncbi:TetR/AcrR family transcriptional regulator [Halopiger aswanensis]|uniref:TetR family transcriptional regulator n=1 Tax=Halopiger aswanensis TaxID=148449 RepID=A0A3R7KKW1_9EURY|nr:TetR/AcrR family transcriptional regulator [Halopiger aswanensis]RKD95114.1 TetR family transcriptional regulator [Halopiger aswanensis]
MKGFSDEERDRIRTELITSGRELFIQYGLERTRIKDITAEVDIGTSTFYQFFDSKEHLYLEVLLREIERFSADLESAVDDVDDPREQVRITLQQTFDEVESNPIVRNLIIEGELDALQSQLPDSSYQDVVDQFGEGIFGPVDEWTDGDAFKYEDPRLIEELFEALVFVTRCKDLKSESEGVPYDEIRSTLIDVIVDGLFEDEP